MLLAEKPGLDCRQGRGIFLTSASRMALRPTQPPILWVPRALSAEIKRPERETDHSFPLGSCFCCLIVSYACCEGVWNLYGLQTNENDSSYVAETGERSPSFDCVSKKSRGIRNAELTFLVLCCDLLVAFRSTSSCTVDVATGTRSAAYCIELMWRAQCGSVVT
jgi:hypothetical protein